MTTIENIVSDGNTAFWDAVANVFPGIVTGDAGPGATISLEEAMTDAVQAWVLSNGEWFTSESFVNEEGHAIIFQAAGFSAPWNGHAVPLVTRRVADRIVALTNKRLAEEDLDVADGMLWSYPDLLQVITLQGPGQGPLVTIEPDGNGLYRLDLGWTLFRVTPDHDMVVGELVLS